MHSLSYFDIVSLDMYSLVGAGLSVNSDCPAWMNDKFSIRDYSLAIIPLSCLPPAGRGGIPGQSFLTSWLSLFLSASKTLLPQQTTSKSDVTTESRKGPP